MASALDFVAELDDDGRFRYAADRRRLRLNLQSRAGGQVRIRVSEPVRSPKQNNYYWHILGVISLAYEEAGLRYSADLLHKWYKALFLPTVAAELLRETGEMVDYVIEEEYPDGRVERTLTTTRLSVAAFSLYCEKIRAEAETELGVSLDEVPQGIRSGKIYEPA